MLLKENYDREKITQAADLELSTQRLTLMDKFTYNFNEVLWHQPDAVLALQYSLLCIYHE